MGGITPVMAVENRFGFRVNQEGNLESAREDHFKHQIYRMADLNLLVRDQLQGADKNDIIFFVFGSHLLIILCFVSYKFIVPSNTNFTGPVNQIFSYLSSPTFLNSTV